MNRNLATCYLYLSTRLLESRANPHCDITKLIALKSTLRNGNRDRGEMDLNHISFIINIDYQSSIFIVYVNINVLE